MPRTLILALCVLCAVPALAQEPVTVHWLGGATPAATAAVSWGVPWPRGAVDEGQRFVLAGVDGATLPLQSWPLAYWPDGTVKWTGFATVTGPEAPLELRIAPAASPAVAEGASEVVVREMDGGYEIDTGAVRTLIPRRGPNLVESMTVDGRVVARDGRLVMIESTGPTRTR